MLQWRKAFTKKGFSLTKRAVSALSKQRIRGFSLIELLVVIGIIGVLAAIAVPAYQSYREDAAKKALSVSMQNVGKAYQVCRVKPSMNELTHCNTLSQLNVACEKCDTNTSGTSGDPRWCIDASDGGRNACLFVAGAAAPPAIITDWEPPNCQTLYSKYECDSTGMAWTTPTGANKCANVTGCSSATPTVPGANASPPNPNCAGTTEYVACTGNATSNGAGTCDTSTGICQ